VSDTVLSWARDLWAGWLTGRTRDRRTAGVCRSEVVPDGEIAMKDARAPTSSRLWWPYGTKNPAPPRSTRPFHQFGPDSYVGVMAPRRSHCRCSGGGPEGHVERLGEVPGLGERNGRRSADLRNWSRTRSRWLPGRDRHRSPRETRSAGSGADRTGGDPSAGFPFSRKL